MTEQLTIQRLAHRGDGVAETPQGSVYVPYALPGETVTVDVAEGHPDRRHLLRVDQPINERVPPICKHFGQCGGCVMQHWSLSEYHLWKRALAVEALAKSSLIAPVDAIVDAHGEGRRRIVLHARRGLKNALEVGFTAPRAHRIVAIDQCPILAPGLDGAIAAAWAIADCIGTTRKPLDIQATVTDSGLDIDVRGSGPLTAEQTAILARLAGARNLARLTRHGELLAQHKQPLLKMGRAHVPLPPGAFLQATAQGEAELAKLVREHLGAAKNVLDLFCGVGPFALRLAERARVTAIDCDENVVNALRRAAAGTSGLKPLAAQVRDLFRRPLTASELKPFDAILFDPPRQGAEAQTREIARSTATLVVAVSCDAATFARDARILADAGFKMARVTPVDQFRYSFHVEIVGKFER